MAIQLLDPYLEDQIEQERLRRVDGSKAKTMASLLRERLTQIEVESRQSPSPHLEESTARPLAEQAED